MIPRIYQNLDAYLAPQKALVIFGARQTGKTTLLKNYLAKTKFRYRFETGDDIRIQHLIGSGDLTQLKEYASGYELIVIDEAQRIPNIGLGLKLLIDQITPLRIIVTGSSSFELAGQVGEPLTGRKKTLTLFPIAQLELAMMNNPFEMKKQLDDFLIYGSYPAVITATSKKEKLSILDELVHSYLLKDVFELERVKSPKTLFDLLRLLAFQVGSEVSLSELGTQLSIDAKTVARYLDLLEKAFVLFNLRGYAGNLRKEIVKKSKYYFFDNGIRNTIISNVNPINLRDDQGKLWENFLVIERKKMQAYRDMLSNNYFWRTWEKDELDWLEEREGALFGFEYKYSAQKKKLSKKFLEAYPHATIEVITRENYLPFVGIDS